MAAKLFSGLIAGVVAGAATGFLLGPKPWAVVMRFVRARGWKWLVWDMGRGSGSTWRGM